MIKKMFDWYQATIQLTIKQLLLTALLLKRVKIFEN